MVEWSGMGLLILFHFYPEGNLESPEKKKKASYKKNGKNNHLFFSQDRSSTDPGSQCSVALVSIGHYNAEALL